MQVPVESKLVPDADLSSGNAVSYTVSVPEGSWYLTAFMDDDGNASALVPGPDAGDPISFPAVIVDIEHQAAVEQDVALTMTMP
jgi:hypothetical protein